MTRLQGWGVTGWSDTWTALDEAGDETSLTLSGYGVQRVVDPGVAYVEQPVVDGVPRWVPKAGSQRRIFEMAWHEDRLPQSVSLPEMQALIAGQRGSLDADDPALESLDAAIMQLVTAAERLHATQATLGFVQPDSVRFVMRHDGTRSLVLPDVGFTWDDRGGLLEPEWLANPQLELLFERGARARNAEYLARLRTAGQNQDLRTRAKEFAGPQAEDVRIIARLIAVALAGSDEVKRWCGNAKALLKLPARDIAPDTEAAIWDKVIAPALDGKITSCGELRIRLEATKPSEHFLFKPPAPPWAGWAVLRQAGAVGAGLAVLAVLWWVMRPGPRAPYCSIVPKSNPLYGMLVELEAAVDDAKVNGSQREALWARIKECRAAHAEFRPCSGDCLQKPVKDYLEMVEKDAKETLEGLRFRPRAVAEERQDLARALDRISEITGVLKQSQDSAVVMKLRRQLMLRGVDAAAPRSTNDGRAGGEGIEAGAKP